MITLLRKDPIIVNDYRLLTIDWAQSVLRLHDGDARVHAVEVVAVHIGTTTRVRLAVDHDSHHVARRWFVKVCRLSQ